MTKPATPTKYEIAVLIAAAVWYALLAPRGVSLSDEGASILHGWQATRGLVMYRDYWIAIAPLTFFTQGGLIELFGFHLIAGRIYVVLQGLIMVMIALRIGRRRLDFPFSLLPGLLLVPFGVSLAGYPHYGTDAFFYLFAALAFFDAHLDRRRARLMLAGAFFASLSVLCKQSMAVTAGGLTLAALLLPLPWGRPGRTGRELAAAALGLIAPGVPFLIYFGWNHALGETYHCLFDLAGMKKVVIFSVLPPAAAMLFLALGATFVLLRLSRKRLRLAAPLWMGAIIFVAASCLLIPSPIPGPLLTATVGAALIAFTPGKPGPDQPAWLLLRLFALMNFVFSLLAGADLGHTLLAVVGSIFLAGRAAQISWRVAAGERLPGLKAALAGGLAVVFATGFYLDLWVPHQSYIQGPRWNADAPVALPGLEGIRLRPEQAAEIEGVVNYIGENTGPDEKIFIYPWHVLLYVCSDRLPATYYTFLYFEVFDRKVVTRVISDLDQERPRIAVTSMDGDEIHHVAFAGEAAMIEGYIRHYYRPERRFGQYQVWNRKEEP